MYINLFDGSLMIYKLIGFRIALTDGEKAKLQVNNSVN